jgi:hypothetical protein
MKITKMNKEKKNYTLYGKSMSNKEFIKIIKDSEESGVRDFDVGIKIVEERLNQYRKIKK